MKKLTIEGKLDRVLSYLESQWNQDEEYRRSRSMGHTIDILGGNLQAEGFQFTEKDLIYIETRLIEDGYIEYLKPPLDIFKLTRKGYLFISRGGYEHPKEVQDQAPGAPQPRSRRKTPPSVNSFTYRHADRNKFALGNLHTELVSAGFLHPEVKLSSFRLVFQNRTPRKPIRWMESGSALAHFIRYIHNKLKVVEQVRDKYKVAFNCFVDDQGRSFEGAEFRSKRKLSAKVKSRLEAAADLLVV